MYKQILMLTVSGIVGSQAALAQVPGEGMCAIVTAVERNSRGGVNRVCFSEISPNLSGRGGIDCWGHGSQDWWYYVGARDPAGETAGKYYISKTPSSVGSVWPGQKLDTGTTKLVGQGDWCRIMKVQAYQSPSVWNTYPENGGIEKMVCRPATGTGYEGCNSLDWLGWQSRK